MYKILPDNKGADFIYLFIFYNTENEVSTFVIRQGLWGQFHLFNNDVFVLVSETFNISGSVFQHGDETRFSFPTNVNPECEHSFGHSSDE